MVSTVVSTGKSLYKVLVITGQTCLSGNVTKKTLNLGRYSEPTFAAFSELVSPSLLHQWEEDPSTPGYN